jgi:flagellar motor switch protein FliN
MSDQPASTSLNSAVATQKWAEALAQLLGKAAGTQLATVVLAEHFAEVPAASTDDLWLLAVCSGALRGEMSVRIPALSAVRIAQIAVREPAGPNSQLSSESREIVLQLLRRAHDQFAEDIRTLWGEVSIHVEPATAAPSWAASSQSWVRFGEGDDAFLLELHLSAALVAAMRTENLEAPGQAPAVAGAEGLSAPPDEKLNLQALMDVELRVALRFGSRRLLLREILDLTPGAVVELDRQVQEPVDMLLDGRVVARGEIVVIDGKYGMRVTEVSPAPR